MHRITPSSSWIISQPLLQYKASSRLPASTTRRLFNTKKPLYLSVSKSFGKEPTVTSKDQITAKHLSADRKSSELIDQLSASNKAASVITISGMSQ
jgi:hypothetical protein